MPLLEDGPRHAELATNAHDGESLLAVAALVQPRHLVRGSPTDLENGRSLVDREEVRFLFVIHLTLLTVEDHGVPLG